MTQSVIVVSRTPRSAIPTFAAGSFQCTPATIMFTDIEDSTGLAVELGLLETARFMTEQANVIEAIVRKHGGIVQSFTGDGVLALWLGTEMTPRETARRGLLAVADLAVKISEWNARRMSSGLPLRRIRIGLHSGDVMLLNDPDGHAPFVFGLNVNIARRVEQAGKGATVRNVDAIITASKATLGLARLGAHTKHAWSAIPLRQVEVTAFSATEQHL
ncbi:adenylate/guanylate cyclase domain-containing protein [Mesorhizobium sp. YR577]|uniref:adenylate/guanylate cyclase domain-containing protein n=1 Tax=Mesorhizobium sp. YR577 TaxID=1884373 RepID=UPI0008E892C1|nr:adenylate/guanylate cyclase domain-containing protein [Mesorhizobium sp. YR577]SFU22867.1 Adenylate and Guanylate cyclase catalytic domain-containing protein [Mesorhizobium sp. YR577]